MTNPTYLDYNATTPLLPKAQEAMIEALSNDFGNPSSIHRFGQDARRQIEKTRKTLGDVVECAPEYITFTSGGTESNNQALRSLFWSHVIIDEGSHDSAYKACESALYLPIKENGLVDLYVLEQHLKFRLEKGPHLISINLANNETGVIQPLNDIKALAKKYDAFLHLDASQALGKIPLSFSQSGADLMTLSAHKMGGPLGVGALLIKETVALESFMRGGGQERNRRSGTQNVPAILGWGGALDSIPSLEHLAPWHRRLEGALKTHAPDCIIFGEESPRLPNTTMISMPGVPNSLQLMHFDLEGIAASTGSACSSGKVSASRVLSAMHPNADAPQTAIRISSGWKTQEEDFLRFEAIWKKILDTTRKPQKQQGTA